MRESDVPTEVREFGPLLSTPVEGALPLLVGGHAVNLWTWFYRQRIGKELDQWLPLTSKDLDLVGTIELLEELKRRFGGDYRLSGPRSPVVGQLVVPFGGKDLKVDVLRSVFGLGPKELSMESPVLTVEDGGHTFTARVIPPLILLQAKAANAASLDQTGRNDLRHLHLMLLVIRAYLAELIEAVSAGAIDSRPAISQLELARSVISSKEALKCATKYGVDFSGIWPRTLLAEATDQRLQNFLKHRIPPDGGR